MSCSVVAIWSSRWLMVLCWERPIIVVAPPRTGATWSQTSWTMDPRRNRNNRNADSSKAAILDWTWCSEYTDSPLMAMRASPGRMALDASAGPMSPACRRRNDVTTNASCVRSSTARQNPRPLASFCSNTSNTPVVGRLVVVVVSVGEAGVGGDSNRQANVGRSSDVRVMCWSADGSSSPATTV
ncbi:hypothetical protein H257_12200 [Aphanomyces astaci]|uniref:Secreted protein n=1 Tax=Aphanomyces astaci TaxID=112090 RepID=W4G1C0_APHAT|nr:hypothetical protein H257_12200 [Aphanomyces astaci]ETV72844.1 hypothetical protein H257_12200 [Aphanomyces astaci]|eukprot:XP_009837630.1 hypothetical protein H257_12200 [Aphanomyces astaci]